MITSTTVQTSEDVAEHYDSLDDYYRDVWGMHAHHGFWETGRESTEEAVRKLVDVVTAELPLTRGGAVCDIGCGYGETARLIHREFGVSVTGFTLSSVQGKIALSEARESDAVDIRVQDWLENDLPESSQDAVISIECISHIEDKAACMREIERVLKPGTRAVVCAWVTSPHPKKWMQRHILTPICENGHLPGIGNLQDFQSWIDAAELTLVDYRDATRNVRRTWPIIVWRILKKLCTGLRYWKLFLSREHRSRKSARSIARLIAGYYLGCLRYGIFVIEKPGSHDR